MNKRSFVVYARYLQEILKGLSRLGRKAERYGHLFKVSVGDEYPADIQIYALGDHGTLVRTGQYYTVPAVDVTVEMDGLIRQDGWELLAKIDRLPGTDLRQVYCYGNTPFDKAWEHADMHCDHCGTAHHRNTVYVVREIATGEERMVGSACLKDYTGIDPSGLISWAMVCDICPDLLEERLTRGQLEDMVPAESRYQSVVKIMALAIETIADRGYVKSSEGEESTKSLVLEALRCNGYPSDEAVAKAEEIRQWLLTDEGQDAISFMEIGTRGMLESGYTLPGMVGYICYWPVAYSRWQERQAEKQKKVAQPSGDFVGEVGKRVEVKVAEAVVVTSWPTQYGVTRIWKITDQSGNVFTWKTSGWIESDTKTIKGTVKTHTEYRGERQTELTRCKCIA